MSKPTYYLWQKDYSTTEEYESAKERFSKLGFRVVTYLDGPDTKNVDKGMKQLIKNHFQEENN